MGWKANMVRLFTPGLCMVAIAQGGSLAFGMTLEDRADPYQTWSQEQQANKVPATVKEASTDVEAEKWNLIDGSCWEDESDRWGRTPTTAVVKYDGTVRVERVSIAKAEAGSKNGSMWILARCDDSAR